jgi:hypothetical protein
LWRELRPRFVALTSASALRLSPRPAPLATAPEQLLLHMPLASRFRRHEGWIIMMEMIVND